MKKTLTYKDLQLFDNAATRYMIRTGYFKPGKPASGEEPATNGEWTLKIPTKFVLNLKNVIKQAAKHFADYSELHNDIHLEHCATDEKTKVVLYTPTGGYQFTKEAIKKVNSEIKELANKTIEIHARITEGDWDLTDEEKEAFNGIVIPEFKTEETEN